MYKIKQYPEDFIVKEISSVEILDNGKYSYYILRKKNKSTLEAVDNLSKRYNIPLRKIGFAGNKDKRAVTEQLISIPAQIRCPGLELAGYGNSPISLGDLKGNKFRITIRNLDSEEIRKLKSFNKAKVPNYFGEQRFSRNNALIGRLLVRKDFSGACSKLIESDNEIKEMLQEHLSKNRNDFIGALRKIPPKKRMLYINSYQSLLFNRFIRNKLIDKPISVPGFGTGFRDYEKELYTRILNEEQISLRDFIIPQFPELSQEGTERASLMTIKDFRIESIDKDKATISFFLDKGCYATELIKSIFES